MGSYCHVHTEGLMAAGGYWHHIQDAKRQVGAYRHPILGAERQLEGYRCHIRQVAVIWEFIGTTYGRYDASWRLQAPHFSLIPTLTSNARQPLLASSRTINPHRVGLGGLFCTCIQLNSAQEVTLPRPHNRLTLVLHPFRTDDISLWNRLIYTSRLVEKSHYIFLITTRFMNMLLLIIANIFTVIIKPL